MLKKLATSVAVVFGLLVLSAGPADARPVPDAPVQFAPGDSWTHETLCYYSVWPWKSMPLCFKVPR